MLKLNSPFFSSQIGLSTRRFKPFKKDHSILFLKRVWVWIQQLHFKAFSLRNSPTNIHKDVFLSTLKYAYNGIKEIDTSYFY